MLQQGFVHIDGLGTCFIDKQSDLCIDGKPCDSLGDIIYEIDGERVRERNFKKYRRYSPQFRQQMIEEDIRESGKRLTGGSCSCSKCGTIAMDEALWI